MPVEGTPFDFRKPVKIGARIDHSDMQLKFGKGYDHNWVIDKPPHELGLVARVYEPTTGRVMEVLSTKPGVQFYTGNHLNGFVGKGGRAYRSRDAFCIEPGYYLDAPNTPHFPTTVLKPGQIYRNNRHPNACKSNRHPCYHKPSMSYLACWWMCLPLP